MHVAQAVLATVALDSAGVYVPGGTAAYPSSVLMNIVPAKVAGVPRIVMVVPTPDGAIDPLVLAAASRAGVDEVYRIGGAQGSGWEMNMDGTSLTSASTQYQTERAPISALS